MWVIFKEKLRNFIEHPHVPFILLSAVRRISPTAARILQYGRRNPNTRQYWNKRYKSGDYQDEQYQSLRHEIMMLVPEKTRVLDAGCGNGRLMQLLRSEKGCICTGIDISDVAVEIVKGKGFHGLQCKLPNLPPTLPDNSFDVCTIIETLEHLSKPERTIRGLSKVVREDGFILVGVPDDCMHPEEFDEHMCSFKMETLRATLGHYFMVDTALSVEVDSKKYLVMRARKESHLQLIQGCGISGSQPSPDSRGSPCSSPDQTFHWQNRRRGLAPLPPGKRYGNGFVASNDPILPPLVVHIIHRLSIGGLENGLVNLINHMPPERYRHTIVCLKESTDFQERLHRPDVPVVALHKREGQDWGMHARLLRLFRRLRPDIVHTRNLSGLEYLAPAALAGVPGRIHGEHGRDIYDLDGLNTKYNFLRKAIKPLVHCHIAVSDDLANWLVRTLGVRADGVAQIYNGVDVDRFHPNTGSHPAVGPEGFAPPGTFVIGTVGRMEAVKDQLTLVRAFLHLLETEPSVCRRLRLVIVGDGPLREEARHLIRARKAEYLAWFPGERMDIPDLMRGLDLFVLPSLAEGISNTILEAMASGLPVVATRVGGNPELVVDGETGMLVPQADPRGLAEAIYRYLVAPERLICHGHAGRKRVEVHFSMQAMVNAYLAVYDAVLTRTRQQANA